MSKPKLALYGAGRINGMVAKAALNQGWGIAAVFNRTGEKVGKDIGQLARMDQEIGVIVQDCDTADYSTLDAEICIVNTNDRLQDNLPAYGRLLGAGINVVCHGVESYYPQLNDPEAAAEIDALAKANNVTFTGCGIWDVSRFQPGILVAGPCTRLSTLYHQSTTNISLAGKKYMDGMGVGLSREQFSEKFAANEGRYSGMYRSIPALTLATLGYAVTSTSERQEPVIREQPVYCPAYGRDIEPGFSTGVRIVAEAATAEGVSARADVDQCLFRKDDLEYMMWQVDGRPSWKVTIERDDTAQSMVGCLINRIADVIAAPPGIQLVSQLGLMKHTSLGL